MEPLNRIWLARGEVLGVILQRLLLALRARLDRLCDVTSTHRGLSKWS